MSSEWVPIIAAPPDSVGPEGPRGAPGPVGPAGGPQGPPGPPASAYVGTTPPVVTETGAVLWVDISNDDQVDLNGPIEFVLGDGAVTTDKLANNAVTTDKIALATIMNEDISWDAAIDRAKIAGLPTASADNRLARYDGSYGALQSSVVTLTDSGRITGLAVAVDPSDAVTKAQLDATLPLAGGTMLGTLNMGGKSLTNLPGPVNDVDAAPKSYVDVSMPAGVVVPFAGTNQPAGWLFCFGQTVSRAAYGKLFEAIGTAYNIGGEVATEFRLPDLRGRVVAGMDNMGGTGAGRLDWQNVLGTVGVNSKTVDSGEQKHLLLMNESGLRIHSHGVTDNMHHHELPAQGPSADGLGVATNWVTGQSPWYLTGHSYSNISINNSEGWNAIDRHNNMQPTILLNYIIKAS